MNSFDDFLPSILGQVVRWLGVNAPLYLAWLAGIVLAISRWRRHPTVSLLTLIALALLLLSSVVGVIVFAWLPHVLIDRSSSIDLSVVYSLVGLVLNAIRAAGWGIILVALFGWRTPPPVAPRYPIPPSGPPMRR